MKREGKEKNLNEEVGGEEIEGVRGAPVGNEKNSKSPLVGMQ